MRIRGGAYAKDRLDAHDRETGSGEVIVRPLRRRQPSSARSEAVSERSELDLSPNPRSMFEPRRRPEEGRHR